MARERQLVVLGIAGSIAAVRCFDLCRQLRREGLDVQVLLSGSARGIVTEQALEFASGRKAISSISGRVEHVKFFGKNGKASLLLIAPATANTISKIAMGIDDTPLTTFATIAIGSGKPVLLAPAMHEPMYEHPIVVENLAKLQGRGVRVIAPLLEDGKAKLAGIKEIVFEARKSLRAAGRGAAMDGKKVLIASGAFSEKIDEVRSLTNSSSGKMGSAIAVACALEGARVKMIGNGEHEEFIELEQAHEAGELEAKVLRELGAGYDYFFCPAAIPDFEAKAAAGKMNSGKKTTIELRPRKKLLASVREKFPKLKIIAFKAVWGKGRREMERIAGKFRKENGLYAVCANDLKKSPFGSERTEVFFCGPEAKWLEGKKTWVAKGIAGLIA